MLRSGDVHRLKWMDHSLVFHLNHFLVFHDSFEDPVSLFERVSEILFVGIIFAMLFLTWGEAATRARRAATGALLSAALAVSVGAVITRLVDRPRPFVADPSQIHLFVAHAADSGFPSDHATAAFAIAAAVMLRDRVWGSALLVVACAVAIGRVAIGVHYPSDVLAGALLGCAAAGICWLGPIRRFSDSAADHAGELIERVRLHFRAGVGYG
jgi:undecaprenyl-diphosphatase